MDPDLSEFEAKPRPRPCRVRTVLAELDEEQREKLTAALAADLKKVPHMKIAEVVTAWGHPLSDNAVGTHRRKRCSCD